MDLVMEDTKQPVTDSQLDSLEGRLKVVLPKEYRSWLLKYNGGHPLRARFIRKGISGPYSDGVVAWFFAVHEGQYENFESKYRFWILREKRLPADLVPIARDPFGNLICLAFDGPYKGRVYFWRHEEEADEPSYDNCDLIADSFSEFIAGLH